MKLLISGSSGFIGGALIEKLRNELHSVFRLVRKQLLTAEDISWNPDLEEIDSSRLEGFDAVVHLAGESIAEGRWTESKKKRIRDTRVKGTQFLSRTLADLKAPPRVFIVASAIGFYGHRGNEILTEQSPAGNDFLASVCQEWENATKPARQSGIRVVNARFGVVLGSRGGALRKMLLPFKLGLGGKIGSGEQFMSWVSLEDVVSIILFSLSNPALRTPINVVAPHPVTNLEFTQILGKVLSRPTLFPLPAFAARLALGEMADALLLSSARVQPKELLDNGYVFQFSELEPALRQILN